MIKIHLPTLQQMRLLEAVARHKSITRAAEEVHLTQPTVSMQIKALEEKIGTSLTELSGRTVHLTREGEEVAAASRDVLARLADMKAALEDMQREVEGPLSVAVVTTAKYFLPRLLGEFKNLYPRVHPQLQITNRERLLERMASYADDLYIMGRPPQEDALTAVPFLENIIVFVARPDHPLADASSIPLSRMAKENVIGREPGSGTRLAVEKLCADAGVTLNTHMEFDDTEAIKQGVISDLGVAYLSLHMLRLELAAGELVVLDVTGFPLRRRWYAVHHKNRRLSNAASAFLAHLEEGSADPDILTQTSA